MYNRAMPTFRAYERLERIETFWSFYERFGVMKAMLVSLGFGGAIAVVTAWLQTLPRWLIDGLVWIVASGLVFVTLSLSLMLWEKAKRGIRERYTEGREKHLIQRIEAPESQVGPRRLLGESRERLLHEVSKQPGKIRIVYAHLDTDAETYAEDFRNLFEEAKWSVWGPEYTYITRMDGWEIGLTLYASDGPNPATQSLAEALEKAQIECHYYWGFGLPSGCCELKIGHRGMQVSD